MDFALTEDQQAVVDLARRILVDRCTPEHLTLVETEQDWFDATTWQALADADLLGLTLPEADGGGGFGWFEACLLLVEVGRAVAHVPLWSTLTAAHTIATFGSAEQRNRWLPGVVSGETVLAVALTEAAAPQRLPMVRAQRVGSTWSLSGVCTTVAVAQHAAAVLVPALGDDEVVVLVVPTDAPGVALERQDAFSNEPQCQVHLDEVRLGAEAVLELGDGGVDAVLQRAVVGWCAMAAGVADVGMRMTAAYVSERQQFDRALGTFQAVGQRMADCYIDASAMELTMLAAASELDAVPSDATIDPNLVAVAKYWASYGGSRVGHADLHLHGGISIDLDYPIHRYFLWAKHLEFALGAGTEQLAVIGRSLAERLAPG
jgi:alkylation response protein AidB-like acyl-CoA dehydrogenase